MGALAHVLRRLRSIARRQELEERLDDEIRFHVEQQIEKNRRAGMTLDEARRRALIRFGGVEQVRERTWEECRAAPIEHLSDSFPIAVTQSGPMITSPLGYPTQGWGHDGWRDKNA